MGCPTSALDVGTIAATSDAFAVAASDASTAAAALFDLTVVAMGSLPETVTKKCRVSLALKTAFSQVEYII